jgi:hypothetical protein
MKIEMIGNILAGCLAATVFFFTAVVLKGAHEDINNKED